jgi:hypothetical protein
MNINRATIVFTFFMALGFASPFLTSCKKKSTEGTIIITRTAYKKGESNPGAADKQVINSRSEIIAIEQGQSPRSLTASFFSARSPEISNDGKTMIFAGVKTEGEPWQIWETDLVSLKTKQLTKIKGDCTDPAYLPLGRFLFTCHTAADSLKSTESIYTSNIDGTDTKRITYIPLTFSSSHVLSDGRILTIGIQKYPESGAEKYLVMRPDGTKSELFYTGPEGSHFNGPGLETTDGRIIFIESEKNNPAKGNLVSVSYTRPMHTRMNLTSETEGDFRAVSPEPTGKLLVAYRKSTSDRYSLYEFDPENKSLGRELYSSADFDVTEVTDVVIHNRARKLPSEVNTALKTGLIMCQDVNLNDDPLKHPATKQNVIDRIEIMGADSSMGVFKPSKDGSFYLKVVANKPFQIRTIDENGKVIRKCDWIWLRNNERRGCVGCHEDQDIVPDNRIPHAVKKAPIGIPRHVNNIKDIMIDTE